MNYLCAYFWQQESLESSLVLKHLTFHEKNSSVVFGCLARENKDERNKANMFVENMTDWFHEAGIGFSQNEGGIRVLEEVWQKKLVKKAMELEGVALLFCVEEHFAILAKGKLKIWLLNNRFGRVHRRELSSQAGEQNGLVCKGSLEPGVGILIAEEAFFEGLSESEILNCLNPAVLKTKVRVQKRLSELAQGTAGKTGRYPAAMMIVTCE